MRRALLALAFALTAGPALAADCYPNAAGTQANCGAVLMWNNGSGQSQPATAAAPVPTVQTGALPAGTALLGKVGIDQTTPGTTNSVAIDGTQISTTSAAALAANTVVKASAGQLYSFNVSADSTLSGAAWWIMIYNATSAPVDGAVTPAKCYAMPSGTNSYSAAFPNPVPFSTGIVIGVSTNGCFTKAASTHAFISGDYK